jgi:hypothetical protein
MNLFRKPLNAVEVPRLLLKELGVKISDATLEQKLEDHPDFPKILAISDVLMDFGVANKAFCMPKNTYNAKKLLFPVIAHSEANGGRYMLVHKIENGRVLLSDEKKRRREISEKDFLERWSGHLLYAQADENSGEDGYFGKQLRGKLNAIKIPLAIIIILISIAFNINFRVGGDFALLLLLKLLGLTATILLLVYSINASNPLLQNLCNLGKGNDCNAILKSDAAKAASWLSWSEVGFFYFAGGFLALLFMPSSLVFLFWLNILALPYTFWSIYYQYQYKNWCVLCCTVQVVLWLEFTVALAFNLSSLFLSPSSLIPTLFNFDFLFFIKLSLCFIAPPLLWYMLKPILQRGIQYKLLIKQLKKFKYNAKLFKHVLSQQPHYAVPDELMPVTLGNPNAEIVITMVSNLYCNPCAKAHCIIEEWLKARNDIQLKIIFTTLDINNDIRKEIIRHLYLITIYGDGEKAANDALNQWYKLTNKDLNKWIAEHPVNAGTAIEFDHIIRKQRDWCELTEITHTPTFFINGYKLHKPYFIEDVKYLV